MARAPLRQILRAAAERRRPLASDAGTTAYRLLNAEGDGLPGVTLDWFEGLAVLSFYRDVEEAEERALLDALGSELAPASVYVKRRPREARVAWTIVGGGVCVREGQVLGADYLELAREASQVLQGVWNRASQG